MPERHAVRHQATEWAYTTGRSYDDPFDEIRLDVVFEAPDGTEQRVPAFWAGNREWRIRFAPSQNGTYRYRTICTDEENDDLHERTGELHVDPYDGDNELLKKGPLEVSDDGLFQHADGTPFFWLGDTWWLALTDRLTWPDEFKTLTADRVEKGFSLVHLVGGLFPDMEAFDERGANEGGFSWEEGFERINPAFFDQADPKVHWLVERGLVPCIFSAWGYYRHWMSVEQLKRHWRYLVARYGAYPVVWSIAGETAMKYYLEENQDEPSQEQIEDWTEIGRYLRELDPYDHPVTTHPRSPAGGRDKVTDESILDFDMLQVGHGGQDVLPRYTEQIRDAVDRTPELPVVFGEGFYDGILEGNREEIQRYAFWSSMLTGLVGFTYGANGIWQLNREGDPYGPSPYGLAWGDTPWTEAYQLPASEQLGFAKGLLERYDWSRFEPHPEWIQPASGEDDGSRGPFAGGIDDEVRVCYFPTPLIRTYDPEDAVMTGLRSGVEYEATFVDPKRGRERSIDEVEVDQDDTWNIPSPVTRQDWVLTVERARTE